MDIFEFAEKIKTKNDFLYFLKLLIEYYDEYKDDIDEWRNNNLSEFIKGLHGFTYDIEGYLKHHDIDENLNNPSWQLFADMLLGAIINE